MPLHSGEHSATFDESNKIGSSTVKQPALTCRSWLVSDASTGKPLLWHLPMERLQPASITKVVAAMVVLEYIDAQAKAAAKGPKVPKSSKGTARRSKKASLLETRCQVSDFGASFAAWVPHFGWNQGTNAQLKAKEIYSVRELLYAMMLPSGNDAAVTLARCFGPLVSRKCPKVEMGIDAEDEEGLERASIALFVGEMNKTAAALGCHETFFKSCHGMADDENLSCAADIATFSIIAMKNPLFAKIVRTIKYKCDARADLGREKGKIWTNTNVLLRSALAHRYDGVKTGWVPRAHGCDRQQREWGTLVTRVSRNTPDLPPDDIRASGGGRGLPMHAGMKLMVVVVGSSSQQDRFSDTQALVNYAWRCLESSACAQSAILGTSVGLNAQPTSTSLRGVLRAAKALTKQAPTAVLADTHFKRDRQTPIKRPLPSSPCISNSSSSTSLSSLLSGASPPAALKPAVVRATGAAKAKDGGGPAAGARGRGVVRMIQHQGDLLRPPAASRMSSEAVLSARIRGAARGGPGRSKCEGGEQSEHKKGRLDEGQDSSSSIENSFLDAANPKAPSSCARTGQLMARPRAATTASGPGQGAILSGAAVSKARVVGVETSQKDMRQSGGSSAERPGATSRHPLGDAEVGCENQADGGCFRDVIEEADSAPRSPCSAGSASGRRKALAFAGCPGINHAYCAFPPVEGATDTAMIEALVPASNGVFATPPCSPQSPNLNSSAPSPSARATPPPSPGSPCFGVMRSPASPSWSLLPTNGPLPPASRITSPALSPATGAIGLALPGTRGATCGAGSWALLSHTGADRARNAVAMPLREALVCNAH